MIAVLIFKQVYLFWLFLTKKRLLTNWLTMATKFQSPIYEIHNFLDTYLEKISKFQGNGFLCLEFWAIY